MTMDKRALEQAREAITNRQAAQLKRRTRQLHTSTVMDTRAFAENDGDGNRDHACVGIEH